MKYLDYCYLCINNRKASELSENPECSNCILCPEYSSLTCICTTTLANLIVFMFF